MFTYTSTYPGTMRRFNPDDGFARQQLIREVGGQVAGECWKQWLGNVPVYGFPRELTSDEMVVLELAPHREQK